jgi:hypothetical protein
MTKAPTLDLTSPVLAIQDISQLKTKSVNFSEFSLDNLPPLPIGVEHGNALLTTYTINPDIEDDYAFESVLTALENRNVDQVAQIRNYAKWLGGYKAEKNAKKGVEETPPILTSIGGIPIKDIAVASGKSVEDFILHMSYKDIIIIALSVRLVIQAGKKGFCFEQRCPVEGCEKPASEAIATNCDLGDLAIIYPDGATSNKFSLTLDKPVGDLDTITLTQLKLYQIPQFRKLQGTGESTDREFMKLHSIQELPDTFFRSRKNTKAISKAIESMSKLGTNMTMYAKCACYRQSEYPVVFPWIQHGGLYGASVESL